MHYIAARRKGDLVWFRVNDKFVPNSGLIPPTTKRDEKTMFRSVRLR